jgi:hypothetical protein
MAQVAPALSEGTEDSAFVPVIPAGASSVNKSKSARRLSTVSRCENLSDTERHLAFTLRALGQPRTYYSLLATLVVCTLLMLLVGVPYAANERRTDANPVLQTAIRGLIVGIWAYFQLGPVFIVNTAITVRGAFHRRFLLSLPLTLGPAVGVAFIPVDGLMLGSVSIVLLTVGIGFVLCFLALSAPFFATEEHKALDQSLGPPQTAIFFMFFGLVTAHIMLTQPARRCSAPRRLCCDTPARHLRPGPLAP